MESSKYCKICKNEKCNKKVQDMQDIKPVCYVEIQMVSFEGDFVPIELCTIDRLGGIDDCFPCNEQCEGTNCENCIVTKIFNEYARLSNQIKACKYCSNPNGATCVECQSKYEMPYTYCCLNECGEHEFCGKNNQCKKGIYLKK